MICWHAITMPQVESVLAELHAQESRHQQQMTRCQAEVCLIGTWNCIICHVLQVQSLMAELQSRDSELTRMTAAHRTIKDAYVCYHYYCSVARHVACRRASGLGARN